MEVTMHMTKANFLTKAMVLPPPPPVPQLTRKRSWNEITHTQKPTTASPALHIPAPLASFFSKKTKRTLASSSLSIDGDDSVWCLGCEGRIGGDSIAPAAMDSLSADAKQFLAEDPFDFEALPHPVLTRQRAVHNVREHMYGVVNDDDMAGEGLGLAPTPFKTLPSRWNSSVVGASLAHVGRVKSSAFQPRRM